MRLESVGLEQRQTTGSRLRQRHHRPVGDQRELVHSIAPEAGARLCQLPADIERRRLLRIDDQGAVEFRDDAIWPVDLGGGPKRPGGGAQALSTCIARRLDGDCVAAEAEPERIAENGAPWAADLGALHAGVRDDLRDLRLELTGEVVPGAAEAAGEKQRHHADPDIGLSRSRSLVA
ncbi:hypothetical protein VQ045_15990 [Aurantimonas sp. E1-2-R+4]